MPARQGGRRQPHRGQRRAAPRSGFLRAPGQRRRGARGCAAEGWESPVNS